MPLRRRAGDAPREAPAAERRLVSVLFADLVGFTTLSESRDAEEVRELLSRYFDTCRRLIELYGGTVEKFIGDAVMAVWGTPTATEDDAERAVRAALDLVAAVSALGDEVGAPELRARAGVLTGEAAVTIGAEGEGMVAGDLVNTASRIQSVAEPGTVLVGESTRRATEQTIVYEDAGAHELKGKDGLTAALAGAARRLGRPRLAEVARASRRRSSAATASCARSRSSSTPRADERKAHLVSVTGIAGIGKSRLAWEFYKYFDGLAAAHVLAPRPLPLLRRGRHLLGARRHGADALPDRRGRGAGLGAREAARDARGARPRRGGAALRRAAARAAARARRAGGARPAGPVRGLAALLRAARRRLSDGARVRGHAVGGRSLLDFIEYLLEWSRNSPLYVITLARPELLERRPTWGAGHRNFTLALPRAAVRRRRWRSC